MLTCLYFLYIIPYASSHLAMKYSKKEAIIRVPSSVMTGVMEMFGIDEDFLEEIFKDWVNEKYDLPVRFVDYY